MKDASVNPLVYTIFGDSNLCRRPLQRSYVKQLYDLL